MAEVVQLKKVVSHKYADILRVSGEPTLIIQSTSTSIPLADFKNIFSEAGAIIEQEGITKLIFDKRSFKVFDPEAMEWYFTAWKEKMFDHGLRTHLRLCPRAYPSSTVSTPAEKVSTSAFPRVSFDRWIFSTSTPSKRR